MSFIINPYRYAGNNFDPDYQAILDYATTNGYTKPNSATQILQNQLVLDLKSSGAWDILDVFYWGMDVSSKEFKAINWIDPNIAYATINSDTTEDTDGFYATGTGFYSTTNWNPTDDGVNYTQNSASFGWLIGAFDTAYGVMVDGDTDTVSRLQQTNATPNKNTYINTLTAFTYSATTYGGNQFENGFFAGNRSTSSAVQVYYNGLQSTSTSSNSSSGLPTLDYNIIYTTGSNNTRVRCIFFGGSFTSTEMYDFYSVIYDYANSGGTVPTGNCITSLPLDSDSTDEVGTNDGTDTSISYVSGLVSNCADFTAGTSSGIEIADDDTLSFGNGTTDSPFSISFAVKWSGTPATTVFCSKKSTSTGADFEYQVDYDGTLMAFYLVDNNFSHYLKTSGRWSPSASTWYHITATYDGGGSNTGMQLYLNGYKFDTFSTSVGTYVAMENLTQPLTIGKNAQNTSRSLNGYMDCFKIWDKELSVEEVLKIATDELAGTDILA